MCYVLTSVPRVFVKQVVMDCSCRQTSLSLNHGGVYMITCFIAEAQLWMCRYLENFKAMKRHNRCAHYILYDLMIKHC